MRSFWLLLLVGLGSLGVNHRGYTQPVPAEFDSPAYRHFLNSPYSYRTYSSLSPGRTTYQFIPWGYQRFYTDPGYVHQRITPYGFESYSTIPGYGSATVTPFGHGSSYTPGYTYQYYVPRVP